jgi:hypothetical protein
MDVLSIDTHAAPHSEGSCVRGLWGQPAERQGAVAEKSQQ